MNVVVLEGTITALTSISHLGGTLGTRSLLRREKVIQPNGEVEEVPIISGNGLRGLLRDRGMLHMLKQLGYGVNEETGEVVGLSLQAFYFLFSGGILESTPDYGLDLESARRWRELVPLISLFGGAARNQILPGKLKVGKAIPICQETAHIIPQRFLPQSLLSIWDLIQEEAYTRKDDEKSEELRVFIVPEDRELVEVRKRLEEELGRKIGPKQQMRYHIETLAAGTQFYWELIVDDPTLLELDALVVVLGEFAKYPFIGGRSSVGLGKVKVELENWILIDPHLAPRGKPLPAPTGQSYLEHLSQKGEEIRRLLDELKAT